MFSVCSSSVVFRISRRRTRQTKAGDLGAAFDAGDQSHKPCVHALEVKEEEHTARYCRVSVIEAGLRQIKGAGLFEGRRLCQRFGGDVAEHRHQVQRLVGFTLADEFGVTGKLFEEVGQREFVICGVLELLPEQIEVARQILGCGIHETILAD